MEISNQLHALATLPIGKLSLVPLGWEAVWDQQPGSMLWKREESSFYWALNPGWLAHIPSPYQLSCPDLAKSTRLKDLWWWYVNIIITFLESMSFGFLFETVFWGEWTMPPSHGKSLLSWTQPAIHASSLYWPITNLQRYIFHWWTVVITAHQRWLTEGN